MGIPQIKRYENGSYWQVTYLNHKSVLINVQSSGTVDEPELLVTIKSDDKLDNHDKVSPKNLLD